jgi:hypothetical protein
MTESMPLGTAGLSFRDPDGIALEFFAPPASRADSGVHSRCGEHCGSFQHCC